MKKVILYIRVSTDEQAENGYSLADQEERLIRYCERNDMVVLQIFREDHSAKTLKRPALTELRAFATKCKDLKHVLFVKWDRFSRKIRDSYLLIDEFTDQGIEPCAIEQPLDLSVPEYKIMLAIYVATPEVENDRRSMNVIRGMRRAKRSGRWMATAPLGYKNSRDENNKPIIVPDGNAVFIQKAFEELLTMDMKIEEVRRRFNRSGLKCSRSNFNRLVHNPVYAGKLYIAAAGDEPEEIVDGIHQPIIDMNTFLAVQEILDERKPKTTKKIKTNDSFPLRGFLKCAQCGNTLTASASRGRLGGRYEYYHCSNGCSERLRAHQVNEDFVKLFQGISHSETIMDLYSDVLHNLFKASDKERKEMQEIIQAKIDRNVEKINDKMDEWTDKKIDVTEYREVKARYEKINADLIREKAKLQCVTSNGKYLKGVIEYLKTLDKTYEKATTENKRLMVGSIFSEKLVYEKNGFRTPEYTELVAYISQENSELEEIKSGLHHKNAIQSRWVVPTGIEPASKV